jgi:hypothetical protein
MKFRVIETKTKLTEANWWDRANTRYQAAKDAVSAKKQKFKQEVTDKPIAQDLGKVVGFLGRVASAVGVNMRAVDTMKGLFRSGEKTGNKPNSAITQKGFKKWSADLGTGFPEAQNEEFLNDIGWFKVSSMTKFNDVDILDGYSIGGTGNKTIKEFKDRMKSISSLFLNNKFYKGMKNWEEKLAQKPDGTGVLSPTENQQFLADIGYTTTPPMTKFGDGDVMIGYTLGGSSLKIKDFKQHWYSLAKAKMFS